MRTFIETVLFGWLPAWIGYSYGHRHGQAFAAKAAQGQLRAAKEEVAELTGELEEALDDNRREPTMKQVAFIISLCRQREEPFPPFVGMTRFEASDFIDWMKREGS